MLVKEKENKKISNKRTKLSYFLPDNEPNQVVVVNRYRKHRTSINGKRGGCSLRPTSIPEQETKKETNK